MYNHLLDTFKCTAEEGSFTKAAAKLYITHTAVRKQINELENYLGVKLFKRNQSGVVLTNAGAVLYEESLKLMKESDRIIQKVQETYYGAPHVIRAGSSTMYPCAPFMNLWDEIGQKLPGWQLKVVPIKDEKKRLEYLERDYDFVVGPYDDNLNRDMFNFYGIGKYRFEIAVPRGHTLFQKKELSLKDMEGFSLMVIRKGLSPANDKVRKAIEENYPSIEIIDIDQNYDLTTFNQCVETGNLLLSLECWEHVHPEIKQIKLKEKFWLEYGLVYRNNSDRADSFIKDIRLVKRTMNAG